MGSRCKSGCRGNRSYINQTKWMKEKSSEAEVASWINLKMLNTCGISKLRRIIQCCWAREWKAGKIQTGNIHWALIAADAELTFRTEHPQILFIFLSTWLVDCWSIYNFLSQIFCHVNVYIFFFCILCVFNLFHHSIWQIITLIYNFQRRK